MDLFDLLPIGAMEVPNFRSASAENGLATLKMWAKAESGRWTAKRDGYYGESKTGLNFTMTTALCLRAFEKSHSFVQYAGVLLS